MGDILNTDYIHLHHHISHQTSFTFCTVRWVISQTLATASYIVTSHTRDTLMAISIYNNDRNLFSYTKYIISNLMSNDTQYEVQLTVAESFSSYYACDPAYYACDPSYYAYKTLLTMHVALLPHLLCMWPFS